MDEQVDEVVEKVVDLNDLIIDSMKKQSKEIINCEVDRSINAGGRSSSKSQNCATNITAGCMIHKQSAVCIVKVAAKIKDRFIDTFDSAMQYMGVSEYWKLRRNPYEYVLLDENGKETNVSIKFVGCDDPENLKSFRARGGTTFRYIWFEELTNFDGLAEVDNIINTMARGKGKHCVMMTYNPPIQSSNWVNKAFNVPAGKVLGYDSNSYYSEYEYEIDGVKKIQKQVFTHSTYLDVIASGHADWLGDSWIAEAERKKVENPEYYRWAYLGEIIGTDANVFKNIKDWDGDTSKLSMREIFRGFDWGYGGPDPNAYVEWFYDRKNNSIYAINEFYKEKMDIPEIVAKIKEYNKHNFPVYVDSANPLLNLQLTKANINAIDTKKYKDSVKGGVKWLQSLNGIYINKFKTPNIYREFSQYEYLIDKDDNITAELPDKDNHSIDASRYAFNLIIRY